MTAPDPTLVLIESIQESQARIEKKLDKITDDHEARLRTLEDFRSKATGLIFGVGLASGAGGTVIGSFLAR